MSKRSYWTCRGCKTRHPRTKRKCPCGRARPPKRVARHRAVLSLPYSWWVAQFGEQCGICGKGPTDRRQLDRDHDHKTGVARGLLCHRHNRGLDWFSGVDELRAAIAYLERTQAQVEAQTTELIEQS